VRAFESRVLSRTVASERQDARGGWTKPNNEELHSVQYAAYFILQLTIIITYRNNMIKLFG
jgi:hypothetical protein